jgi:hypothetical protein
VCVHVNIYNSYACTYTEMTLRSNAGLPASGKAHGVPEMVHSKTFIGHIK